MDGDLMNLIHDYIYKNKNGKRIYPQIYIYSDKSYPDWIKIGYTTRKDPEERVREQYSTLLQLDDEPYVMIHVTEAVRYNGVAFTDNEIHRLLGTYTNIPKRGEFYHTNDLYAVSKLILDIKNDRNNFDGLRPVGKAGTAIDKTPRIPQMRMSSFKPVGY